MNSIIENIHKTLISISKQNIPIDIRNGKMGVCIYFFYIGSIKNNSKYIDIANQLLKDIYTDICNIEYINPQSTDIIIQLADIGIGIDYLINNEYIRGNINQILQDVDSCVFKALSCPETQHNITIYQLIHLTFYSCIRLEKQKKNRETELLFKELIIEAINLLYSKIEIDFFKEPLSFSLDFELPMFLFIIGKVYNYDFYNNKIIKILEEFTPRIISLLPAINANKLYLLWGIEKVQNIILCPNLHRYIKLLKHELDIDYIISHELKDKSITINRGLSGIYLLLIDSPNLVSLKYINKIKHRIKSSEYWNLIQNDKRYLEKNVGLLDGFCGISIMLNEIDRWLIQNNKII